MSFLLACTVVSPAAKIDGWLRSAQLLCCVWLFVAPWNIGCQAPLSMGFSRQENWNRLPFPTPGDPPDPGIESESTVSPALVGRFFSTEPPGYIHVSIQSYMASSGVSSVPFSHSAVSDFLRPHGWRTPGLPVYHQLRNLPKLMSIESVMASNHLILCCPLLLLPSIFPSIRVFSNESVFAWGGQSIGVSASTSVLPMNIQDWFPLGWTCWISLQSKGLSKVFSNITVQKHQFFGTQFSL